jgi:anaerobic magnesium-protoporphyrin IX monomethyl ester cyclase
MKIMLINPPRYNAKLPTLRDEICFQDVIFTPFPLRLAQIGGILKLEHDVKAIDANAEALDLKQLEEIIEPCDLVIIQSAAGLIEQDLKTFSMVKAKLGPQVRTLLIESVVAPIYPEQFLNDFPELDIIIRGQPEAIIPKVTNNIDNLSTINGIAYRKNGAPAATEPEMNFADLEKLPYMAYELFPMKKYTMSYFAAPMYERIIPGIRLRTTRDCPYGCPFCIIGTSIWRGYDRIWKKMSPKRAIDEIEYVVDKYSIRGFYFWDETFTLDQVRAEEMCDEIIKRELNILWRCLTRIDCINPGLIEKMAAAGCKQIEYGLEAGDFQARKQMHKNFDDQTIRDAVKLTQKAGITANCDIIVGMPWDNHETLQRTEELAKKLLADNIHLTLAFPYPETKFYQMVKNEGLLEKKDLYNLMVHQRVRVEKLPICRTRHMSSEEVIKNLQEIRKRINKHYFRHHVLYKPSSFWRYLKLCSNVGDIVALARKGIRSIKKNLFS